MTIARPASPPSAESVYAFSQPAVEQPDGQTCISESPGPAEGMPRRNFLAALAVLSAALPVAAEVQADPMFELIETHRSANAAHLAAIDEAARLEQAEGGDWGHLTDKPCQTENDTFDILLGAAATTLPGLLAKLAYLRAIADGKTAWMLEDRDGAALKLIDSFAASLKNVGLS
ncbi:MULTISPECIES: hypothetical protein [Bradyrhizobium]|uniref:hypothetical protein n=1 Tax=Bradyrhizobium elkanii TaxID=29448 RepID=UPI0012BC270B|nr:hypothetical protein [Bradyrhizobium elkanii]